MYVTRRLSMYKKDPTLASLPPPDGTDTGILVIQDVENQFRHAVCFVCMLRFYDFNTTLPFPQNKILAANELGENNKFLAIPVINEPLSAGLYYVISRDIRFDAGGAFTSRKPGESQRYGSSCFKFDGFHPPRALDPSNKYQQFYFKREGKTRYKVKSLASDGIVPWVLRNPHNISSGRSEGIFLFDDAFGLDHSRRECLPKFSFPLSHKTSDAVEVGKWYCPFMFVKELNLLLYTQMTNSVFYEMTLKQQWVRIFSCSLTGDSVAVDVNVETEVVDVLGMGNCDSRKVIGGIKWFEALDKAGEAVSVGLDRAIIEKINRDQESFGWDREKDKVKTVEKFEGKRGEWKKFGCYVLVERYTLTSGRRLVLTYEFRHTHRIRCKWE